MQEYNNTEMMNELNMWFEKYGWPSIDMSTLVAWMDSHEENAVYVINGMHDYIIRLRNRKQVLHVRDKIDQNSLRRWYKEIYIPSQSFYKITYLAKKVDVALDTLNSFLSGNDITHTDTLLKLFKFATRVKFQWSLSNDISFEKKLDDQDIVLEKEKSDNESFFMASLFTE